MLTPYISDITPTPLDYIMVILKDATRQNIQVYHGDIHLNKIARKPRPIGRGGCQYYLHALYGFSCGYPCENCDYLMLQTGKMALDS